MFVILHQSAKSTVLEQERPTGSKPINYRDGLKPELDVKVENMQVTKITNNTNEKLNNIAESASGNQLTKRQGTKTAKGKGQVFGSKVMQLR